MEREFHLLLRLLEKGGAEPLEVLQEYYYKLIRMRGLCGETLPKAANNADLCCLPKGHGGFHASEWEESPTWGYLYRSSWKIVDIEGKSVVVSPLHGRDNYSSYTQIARYGGWRIFKPLVPYPLHPRKED